MSNHEVSSCTSTLSPWKYDVFVSFRGEDTRKNFTDHLYTALDRKGINVFKDDKKLERGKAISQGLFEAIEESRFIIIVFSRNYAYSAWCLDELVKIEECKNTDEQMVFPIFYDVNPSVVRKQTGFFQEAFTKHEEAFKENIEKVQKWRNVLTAVANLSGWDLNGRHEAEFVQEIVKEISNKLSFMTWALDDLVGINSRMEKLKPLIDIRSNDVRMIGICGMGGIGKTTIARVVYNSILHKFEGSSFLANVREISEKDSLVALQKQLLSLVLREKDIDLCNEEDGIQMIKRKLQHKRVLIVIDDANHVKQLNKLVGKSDWFGSGSRIIITTRDQHLLVTHEVHNIYKVEALNHEESLQLFTRKAFHGQPPKGYVELTQHSAVYAGGLPLALEVLGSFLVGRTIDEWKSTLKRLSKDSEKEILDMLQISYDGLEDTEKEIFLDLACFFNGKNRDYVTKILDGCGYEPIIGIRVLIDKSLITISDDNRIMMHHLLQEMGQQLVKRQSPKEPEKRSRLWEESDVCHVMTENTGTKAVEGLIVKLQNGMLDLSPKAFSKMINLRLLKIHNVQLHGDLEYLSNKLRLLKWDKYPLKYLPSSLQLNEIVELKMRHSHIKQLWQETKPLNNLKLINLSHSRNLIKTPDFTVVPDLEELILEGCTRLSKIHPSLLVHKKLIILNLKDCTSLTKLSSKIGMDSLRKIVLSGCSKLKKFPEIVGRMENLSELLMDGTAIKELPFSVKLLSKLVLLNLQDCKSLESLPGTIINGLKRLKTLNLSGCLKLKKFPEIVESMECLSELILDRTAIKELPLSIELLTGLDVLNLTDCHNLKFLPANINGLKNLNTLNLSGCSKLENVPETLWQLGKLRELDLSGTFIGQPVPSFFVMKNLEVLSFRGCILSTLWCSCFPFRFMLRTSDPIAVPLHYSSGLSLLVKLNLSDCSLEDGVIISDICRLFSLKELDISKNNFISLPPSIKRLSELQYLNLGGCRRLKSLPELPLRISSLILDGCVSLETLSNPLKFCKSDYVEIYCGNCSKLHLCNSMIFSMLKGYLQAVWKPRTRLSFVFPGSEVPEWFSHQIEGSSIRIKRPPEMCNDIFMGYVVCFVFVVHHGNAATHTFNCNLKFGDTSDIFQETFSRTVSDHLWLLFIGNDDKNYSEFSFVPEWGSGWEVKRSGVHPLYKQELENLLCSVECRKCTFLNLNADQAMSQSSNSNVGNMDRFIQDFVGSLMDDATSRLSCVDFDGAQETSESDSYDEESQPKRFRDDMEISLSTSSISDSGASSHS